MAQAITLMGARQLRESETHLLTDIVGIEIAAGLLSRDDVGIE
jgi:hypothetical protein